MGYLVLRFWNNEVHENVDGVLESILNVLIDPIPFTPTLSPAGRGRRAADAMLSYIFVSSSNAKVELKRLAVEGMLVAQQILNALDRSDPPHPTPLPRGERENKRRGC